MSARSKRFDIGDMVQIVRGERDGQVGCIRHFYDAPGGDDQFVFVWWGFQGEIVSTTDVILISRSRHKATPKEARTR